ncbi:MAG: tetratricopeptide repeat protein [Candidatus Hodarchaeales archaeon]|jgi:tetratricopeptide (TPR) repeat protein
MPKEQHDLPESLQNAEELMYQGNYEGALQMVSVFEKKEDMTPEEQLLAQLLKGQILIHQGNFQVCLQHAQELLAETQRLDNAILEVDVRIIIAGALEGLEKGDESLQALNEGEQALAILTDEPSTVLDSRKAALLFQKGRSLWRNADPVRAVKPLEQSMALYKQLGNQYGMARSLRNIGAAYLTKSEADLALEAINQSLTLAKEHGFKQILVNNHYLIGVIYRTEKDEADQALEHLQRSLALCEKLGSKTFLNAIFYEIGTCYLIKGVVDQAEEFYQKCLAIVEEIGGKGGIAGTLANIGDTYGRYCEMDQALEYSKKALQAFEDIEVKEGIAFSLALLGGWYWHNGELELAQEYSHKSLAIYEEIAMSITAALPASILAVTYQHKGDFDTAFKYCKQTLALSEENGNDYHAAFALSWLVYWNLDLNKLDEARTYNQQLQELYTRGYPTEKERKGLYRPLRPISQIARLSEARLLKASPGLRDKLKAQELFREVAEERAMAFTITATATLNFCELLLFEARASGEVAVLQEAKTLIQQFATRARRRRSFYSIVDALILQAKMAMVEGDLTAAMQFLDQAEMTAKEKGLHTLVEKAAAEQNVLESQYDTWERLIQNNAPLQARLEQARLDEYFQRALKTANMGFGQ